MELTPVQSSNVECIGYDTDIELLIVKFRDGSLYGAFISPTRHAALMAAPSKGRFLAQQIPLVKIPVLKDKSRIIASYGSPSQECSSDPAEADRIIKQFQEDVKRAKGPEGPPPDCGFAVIGGR